MSKEDWEKYVRARQVREDEYVGVGVIGCGEMEDGSS